MKKQDTSWGNVAQWYDELLDGTSDTYQSELILPNVLRLLQNIQNKKLLDLACGQGFFSRAFVKAGARVVGVDAAPALIEIAKKKEGGTYHVAPADNIAFVSDASMDIVTLILALQNIEHIAGTFKEVARVLKPQGRLLMVLNHPAFRVPRASGWGWDPNTSTIQTPVKVSRNAPTKKEIPVARGVQYRRIDRYLSESRVEIDMHPGLNASVGKSVKTISFHRPLQLYAKQLEKNGFAITRLEEWNSEKKSERGPRQAAEDRARKEIPLFLFIEAKKLLL